MHNFSRKPNLSISSFFLEISSIKRIAGKKSRIYPLYLTFVLIYRYTWVVDSSNSPQCAPTPTKCPSGTSKNAWRFQTNFPVPWSGPCLSSVTKLGIWRAGWIACMACTRCGSVARPTWLTGSSTTCALVKTLAQQT